MKIAIVQRDNVSKSFMAGEYASKKQLQAECNKHKHHYDNDAGRCRGLSHLLERIGEKHGGQAYIVKLRSN